MAQTLTTDEARTVISTWLSKAWTTGENHIDPIYPDYVHVDTMGPERVDMKYSGLGKLTERDEVEDIDYDDILFGTPNTIRPTNWARGFRISEEAVEDLADSPNSPIIRAKIGAYENVVKQWRRSAEWVVDEVMAARLLNGTSTATRYALGDGTAWFGNHTTMRNPTLTQTNLASHVSMSATSLDRMITTMGLQMADNGDYMNQDGKMTLVVSATDATRAWELVNTSGQVDSANNNRNILDRYKGKLKIVVNPFLNVQAATFSGYFLLRDDTHGLYWFWRVKPKFAKDSDFDAIALKYRARMRGRDYVEDWRGAVGDIGS